VAQSLNLASRRPADFIARYGGEEFVGILPNTFIEKAAQFAQRLRHSVEELNIPHEFSLVNDKITVSLGCAATIPTVQKSYDLLIKNADKALYEAKSKGRNQLQ
jgi:diguanylate cyclase (GGDEF)-like protein